MSVQLPFPGVDRLKDSKIGRQCMFLYKHAKETPANKRLLWSIIEKWARPIHKRIDSYTNLSAEQRQELDVQAANELPVRRFSVQDERDDSGLRCDGRVYYHSHVAMCDFSGRVTPVSFRVRACPSRQASTTPSDPSPRSTSSRRPMRRQAIRIWCRFT